MPMVSKNIHNCQKHSESETPFKDHFIFNLKCLTVEYQLLVN